MHYFLQRISDLDITALLRVPPTGIYFAPRALEDRHPYGTYLHGCDLGVRRASVKGIKRGKSPIQTT